MKSAILIKSTVLAVFALALSPLCTAQANLAGDWQGTLEVGGNTMHVVWHAVAAADGTLTSTFDNIDENIYGIKVKSTTLKGSTLTMTVDDVIQVNGQDIPLRGSFEGTLDNDAKELKGTWTQTDPEQPPAEIHFTRTAAQAAPAAAAPPPTTGQRF